MIGIRRQVRGHLAIWHRWQERRRQSRIDAALKAGYDAVPEDIEMTAALAQVSTTALAAATLDW